MKKDEGNKRNGDCQLIDKVGVAQWSGVAGQGDGKPAYECSAPDLKVIDANSCPGAANSTPRIQHILLPLTLVLPLPPTSFFMNPSCPSW